jgi:hypothetical protein
MTQNVIGKAIHLTDDFKLFNIQFMLLRNEICNLPKSFEMLVFLFTGEGGSSL